MFIGTYIFPTYMADNEPVIEDGRLCALDDPGDSQARAKIRQARPHAVAGEEVGSGESPGINVKGDYWRHYANDPLTWVKTELDICRNWHHLFTEMVGGDPKYCNDEGGFWTAAASAIRTSTLTPVARD